jgi:hypothetical protein
VVSHRFLRPVTVELPFIKIKFAGDRRATVLAGNLRLTWQLEGPGKLEGFWT